MINNEEKQREESMDSIITMGITLRRKPPPKDISLNTQYVRPSHGHLRTRMRRNTGRISVLAMTSVIARILIKPYENEHFRWSMSQEAGPSWDCSRCRCARHWAPWATKCGNKHFHCNAVVAPSWQLRRPTGQHVHKCYQ